MWGVLSGRLRYVSLVVLFLLSSSVLVLSPLLTSLVSASSAYDGALQLVNKLPLKRTPADIGIETNTTWTTLAQGTGSTDINGNCTSTDAMTQFSDALSNNEVTVTSMWIDPAQVATNVHPEGAAGTAYQVTVIIFPEVAMVTPVLTWSTSGGGRVGFGGAGGGNTFHTITLFQRTANAGTVYRSCNENANWGVPASTAKNYNFQPSGLGTQAAMFLSGLPPNYPSGYAGELVPQTYNPQILIYPTININVDAANNVTLLDDPSWTEKYNLPNPDARVFTLTDEDDNIIAPSKLTGPYPEYHKLPDGNYIARYDVVYTDEDILYSYDFGTTEYTFQANHTDYSIIWNGSQYCSVRAGYEWNCDINQQGDTPVLVTGDPAAWTEETCDLLNMGGCVRNILHWLGEYFGINGSGIKPGASPFLGFDTDTHGLTSIILAPVFALNSLTSSSCSPLVIPFPFTDSDITLPCYYDIYEDHFGSVFTLYQTVVTGIIAYYVIVGILQIVKGIKDPEENKIEVLKL